MPPNQENDNRVFISLTIRGETRAEALVRDFAELYIENNNNSFEYFEDVYQMYEQVIGPANPGKLNREQFLRTLKNCVDGVKYAISKIPGKEGFYHCLENIRLVRDRFSEDTGAADAQP
jgi:hypothetical protein